MSRVALERGVWEALVPGIAAGARYGFRVDGGEARPDPVSRSQPEGVHALSEVVDPNSFTWTDDAWAGLALADYVIYELHVGTFTPAGTFDAAIQRLADLKELGVTAVELMPVASFPGTRNWGYDGVHLYAPQWSYGGPEGLRRFVDAAHGLGLAVVLDVVYNHVGPEGNYLDTFGPYFTDVYRTPWGRGMNYDGPGSDSVRQWAHDNALHWIAEYHVDALRLDAVHGIFDFGAVTFLEDLSDQVHELGRRTARKVQLMAESDLNDPRVVRPPELGGLGMDAQWSDDFHHTVHALLTGERSGYYVDYLGIATPADVYREPFFYARRHASHRNRVHGRSSAGIPRQRFIVCAQNHDQVGNRAMGERLAALVTPDRQRIAAALTLLSPYVPLLFMGEEHGETNPFLYFIEHGDPELAAAVQRERRREFPGLATGGVEIDPQAEESFRSSKVDWSKASDGTGAQLRALYRDLLALRREEPALRPGASETHVHAGADWFTALRVMPLQHDIYDPIRARRALFCAFNLCDQAMNVPVRADALGAWTLRLSTDAPGYGGVELPTREIPSLEVHAASTVPVPREKPRSLFETAEPATESRTRTVRMAAWSAAVYVRQLDDRGATTT